jgi:thioredoxin-like negative regulator of GroEL
MEEAAETNCDSLISRALSIAPQDIEVRLALASIRMSQQRFEEAKAVILALYEEIDEKEPC